VHVTGFAKLRESCVAINESCTVTEILVFGRENSFPTQTLQRRYMYTSPHKLKQTWLMLFKAALEF
jgi:hypothetical protein